MRTILGLLGIAAVLAALIIGYNWFTGTNSLKIETPSKGSTLYTDTARVKLSASDATQATLAQTGNEYQIVTYVDGREVRRGKDLTYDISKLSAGKHELKVAIADNRNSVLDKIALQPGAVDFTVSPTAATGEPYNTLGSAIDTGNTNSTVQQPAPTPTPVVVPNTVASSQQTGSAQPALPRSGLGGGQQVQALNIKSANMKAVNFTNYATPPAPPETPIQAAVRSLFAFYVAGFVVVFGFVMFKVVRGRRRHLNRVMVRRSNVI